MEKSILVTGAAGFIGSHLCEYLINHGNQVIGVDNLSTGSLTNLKSIDHNPFFQFITADVSTSAKDYLDPSVTIKAIYHLASPASPLYYQRDPIATYQANAHATERLLQLARDQDAKFLFASTSEVYGDPLIHPQSEDYWGNVNIRGIRACYDESKRFGEMILSVWQSQYSLDCKTVRIFNTYGPKMDPDDGRIIPNFITQSLADKPVTVYGDGLQTRSLCFVDDLVEGLVAVMDSTKSTGQVYNLGNPDEYTVLDLAKKIIEHTNSHSRIVHLPLPADDPKQRRPDINKIKTEIGWEPRTSFEQGLAKTTAYFRQIG